MIATAAAYAAAPATAAGTRLSAQPASAESLCQRVSLAKLIAACSRNSASATAIGTNTPLARAAKTAVLETLIIVSARGRCLTHRALDAPRSCDRWWLQILLSPRPHHREQNFETDKE